MGTERALKMCCTIVRVKGDTVLDHGGRNGGDKNIQKGKLGVHTRHEHSIWHVERAQ